MNNVWRQTGRKPKELDQLHELPLSCYHAWKAFIDLNSTRGNNGFSPNPISYHDTWSYCQLHNIHLEDWELALLRKFDMVVLKLYNERAEKQQASSKK